MFIPMTTNYRSYIVSSIHISRTEINELIGPTFNHSQIFTLCKLEYSYISRRITLGTEMKKENIVFCWIDFMFIRNKFYGKVSKFHILRRRINILSDFEDKKKSR